MDRDLRAEGGRLEPVVNGRDRLAGGSFSGGDDFRGVVEGVVAEAANVGSDDQVGRRLPWAAHLLLGNGEALSDDVENVARAFQVYPVSAEIDGHHAVSA